MHRCALLALVMMLSAGPARGQEVPPSAAAAQPEAAPVYDESADGERQIADALAAAGRENRRVLIQWGANWCGWCIKLHELSGSNPEIRAKLLYEYDVVHIDIGRFDKHMELAAKYGADLQASGVPFLTVLDADGNVVANQETGSLENPQGAQPAHNVEKVLGFLTTHQAEYRSATGILEEGLARAKSEGKAAFVHFGAPWCGWCHKLEAFLARDDMAPLFAEHFVDVKIDTDRTIGGGDVLLEMRGSQQGGIPWFVFLDSAGEPIATSSDSGQNTGFPVAPEEIAAFMEMLRKVKPAIPAEPLDRIETALRQGAKSDG
ncbi:MAG TPA: thioredoxin family protein [Phycisphaerales bacterium]|nr:thioredoxin family protein [Phycisphaerales bacterium]